MHLWTGVIAPTCQQPLRRWQTAQQGSRKGGIADLTCGLLKPDRTTCRIFQGEGIIFSVFAAAVIVG
jgi:hypothetical protein